MSGGITTHATRQAEGLVRDAADIVVLGSGAAGATVARVLTEAGLDVVLLEEGPPVNKEALRRDVWSAFRDLWRDAGLQAASGRAYTPILQGSCVGGTTVVNGAIVHRVPEPILARWQGEFRLAEALPTQELDRIFSQLERELQVAPTPDDIAGPHNLRMGDGLRALGWSGQPIHRNVVGCEGATRCLQGCPTHRKQAMHVTYIPASVQRGARVHAECRAERIVCEGTRATQVIARSCPRGESPGTPFVVHARRGVVVAASAIQTPLLLAASGFGRRSGLVGRRFSAHPGASVLGVFDEPVLPWSGATQGYESKHFWDEHMKFESVGVPLEVLLARMPGVGRRWIQGLDGASHLAQWGVQIRAQTHGRVRRGWKGRPRITYDLVAEDVQRFHLGLRRVCMILFAAGAREVWPGIHGLPEVLRSPEELRFFDDLALDPRAFHAIASHLFGTAVAGPDDSTSVVDPWRRVHETTNVWVADSSTFPTNMGVNPQHTICALAWLTAEHIADHAPREA